MNEKLGQLDSSLFDFASGVNAFRQINLGTGEGAGVALTIASGIITISRSHHTVDVQTGTTDDLDTINGGVNGDELTLRLPTGSTNTVVVKHNTGNIVLAGGVDATLDSPNKALKLFYNGTKWTDEISTSAGERYFHFRDEKASGIGPGSSSPAAWNTRTLNTTMTNTGSLATLAANRITLPAGTYRVRAHAPAFQTNNHMVRLRNITDGTTTLYGSSENAGSVDQTPTRSFLEGQFTITAAKDFELQHYTVNSGGLGIAASIASQNEVYATIEFWKKP
jgi:hypothetical protein